MFETTTCGGRVDRGSRDPCLVRVKLKNDARDRGFPDGRQYHHIELEGFAQFSKRSFWEQYSEFP